MIQRKTAVVVLLVALAACASRQQAASRTADALSAALTAWKLQDARAELQVVADAPSEAAGRLSLAAHRAVADKVYAAFQVAFAASAAALLSPSDVNMGRLAALAAEALAAWKGSTP